MTQVYKIAANYHSFTTDRNLVFAKALEVANQSRQLQVVFENDIGFSFVSLEFWRFSGEGMDGIFEDCFKVGQVCPE